MAYKDLEAEHYEQVVKDLERTTQENITLLQSNIALQQSNLELHKQVYKTNVRNKHLTELGEKAQRNAGGIVGMFNVLKPRSE